MNAKAMEPNVTRAQQLRRKAELCRRAASITTQGGLSADRALIELAQRLEQEADGIERALGPKPGAPWAI